MLMPQWNKSRPSLRACIDLRHNCGLLSFVVVASPWTSTPWTILSNEHRMDGEKERERERGEEKESDEAEDLIQTVEEAALEWQERNSDDDIGLPIMHWESLSLQIAELEKQEEDKRLKRDISVEHGSLSKGWIEEQEQRCGEETWEGAEDDSSNISVLTSRLQTRINLQLCFINNSESEDEDDDIEISKETSQVSGMGDHVPMQPAPSLLTNDTGKPVGLQSDHKEKEVYTLPPQRPTRCEVGMERRRLNRGDLQSFSLKQLNTLKVSLNQAIQDLSAELVGRLQTRDQLRTEQDAMLLEVQDMTSLRCDDQRNREQSEDRVRKKEADLKTKADIEEGQLYPLRKG
ncbi:hypothetical protein GJAV_G00197860 [Gymnothorax javanicus]|nr:hypothetical protein GJAV_G00197860 [Gymnothorax javanicus]